MQREIESIHKLSIASIVCYLLLFLPGMIIGIVASAKCLSIERLKTVGIIGLVLTILTIIGGWVMMIVICSMTGKNSQ